MDELDLSGVDPLRRDEVRRRVGVVKDFLSIPLPTDDDRKAHAVRLGLSVNQFMMLVRTWREYGSAARLAASGAHRGASRRASRLAVDGTAKTEAAKVIDELGADASLVEITKAVNARCEALGVKPPSRSTLWNMAMERRGDHGGAETGIVIATCAVRLPMAVDGGVDLPALTMAVRASDGAVLAAALDAADWQTAAATIAASSGDAGPVRADKALLTWKRAVSLRAGVEPVLGAKARSAVSRILGTGIEDVRLIYRLDKAVTADRLLRTKEDRPLPPADVRAVVASAIARHNAARAARDAAWIDAATSSTGA